jgi:sRNA-binding carbon storage regulator CsrA
MKLIAILREEIKLDAKNENKTKEADIELHCPAK